MNFEYDKSVNILANSWRLHNVIQNESTKRKKHDREKKTFFRGSLDFFQISGRGGWPKGGGMINFNFYGDKFYQGGLEGCCPLWIKLSNNLEKNSNPSDTYVWKFRFTVLLNHHQSTIRTRDLCGIKVT